MSAVAMPQMDGKERMLKYPQVGPGALSVPPVAGDFRVLRGNPGGRGCADVSVPKFAWAILSPRRHAPAECGARKLFIPFFRRRPADVEEAASQLSWPDHRGAQHPFYDLPVQIFYDVFVQERIVHLLRA